MWSMIWPAVMVVMSNVVYNICQKYTPEDADPFAALFVTYVTAALVTAVIFLFTKGPGSTAAELKRLNWTSFVLGAAIIGLEFGYIFLYRSGWKVSAGSVVCNISLAVVLLFVGKFLFSEQITIRQLLGAAVCAAGLILITG